MTAVLAFVAMFALLVAGHEWGHFIVAKKSGVLIREFSIGMGWKLFQRTKNHTTYTLRALPFGGYVSMASRNEQPNFGKKGQQIFIRQAENGLIDMISEKEGLNLRPVILGDWLVKGEQLTVHDIQTEEEQTITLQHRAVFRSAGGQIDVIARESDWIESQPIWRRILTFLAGPLMNVVLAVCLFSGAGLLLGNQVEEARIGTIVADSPLEDTRAQEDDVITNIDGTPIALFSDLKGVLQDKADEEVTVTFNRDGEEWTETLRVMERDGRGVIGVQVAVEHGIANSLAAGVQMTSDVLVSTLQAIGDVIMDFDINKFGGPVFMAKTTGEVTSSASSPTELFYVLMTWCGMLSINLALLNLMPIPALDGGRIVMASIEGIRKKAISESLELKINVVSAGVLLIFMFAVTFNDLFLR